MQSKAVVGFLCTVLSFLSLDYIQSIYHIHIDTFCLVGGIEQVQKIL